MNDRLRDLAKWLLDVGPLSDPRTQQHVWDILTALRGPDSVDEGLKEATTCVIRYKFFGCTHTTKEFHLGAFCGPDREAHVEVRERIKNDDRMFHFFGHAANAFQALGLKWGEVNE